MSGEPKKKGQLSANRFTVHICAPEDVYNHMKGNIGINISKAFVQWYEKQYMIDFRLAEAKARQAELLKELGDGVEDAKD